MGGPDDRVFGGSGFYEFLAGAEGGDLRRASARAWTSLSDAERRYVHELDLLETTDTVHHPYVPT